MQLLSQAVRQLITCRSQLLSHSLYNQVLSPGSACPSVPSGNRGGISVLVVSTGGSASAIGSSSGTGGASWTSGCGCASGCEVDGWGGVAAGAAAKVGLKVEAPGLKEKVGAFALRPVVLGCSDVCVCAGPRLVSAASSQSSMIKLERLCCYTLQCLWQEQSSQTWAAIDLSEWVPLAAVTMPEPEISSWGSQLSTCTKSVACFSSCQNRDSDMNLDCY